MQHSVSVTNGITPSEKVFDFKIGVLWDHDRQHRIPKGYLAADFDRSGSGDLFEKTLEQSEGEKYCVILRTITFTSVSSFLSTGIFSCCKADVIEKPRTNRRSQISTPSGIEPDCRLRKRFTFWPTFVILSEFSAQTKGGHHWESLNRKKRLW